MTNPVERAPVVERDPDGPAPAPGAVPVLVVGAGPTGLLLAAELHRRGIACHLIDARPEPLHWDRATVVHPRSLELFESLGLIDAFLAAGVRQRAVRLHSGGRLLGEMDLATSGSRYGFNLGVSEETTEAILTDHLHAHGGAVTRSSRLVGLDERPDGVVAEIERDGARHAVHARWVVGCDGLHSPVRELTGIAFDGHDIAAPWAVFDATVDGWADDHDVTFAFLDRIPVILTALPQRRWRVYLRPAARDSDVVADAASTLALYRSGAAFADVENATRFHCHTKVAARFRAGRVLLAGDAAHVCSPAEGHGMNTGLQDAGNLAWKLALVGHGQAGPGLLDSYEAERRPVAERVARSGDATEHAQTLTDPDERAARDRALTSTYADPTARHHEVVAEVELDVDYAGSPIVAGSVPNGVAGSVPNGVAGSVPNGVAGSVPGRLAAGARVPDTVRVALGDGSGACHLHQLAYRAGHTVLVLGGRGVDERELTDLAARARVVAAGSALVDAVVGVSAGGRVRAPVARLEPDAADDLGIDGLTFAAVRPDGVVGLRADHDHIAALREYHTLLHVEAMGAW